MPGSRSAPTLMDVTDKDQASRRPAVFHFSHHSTGLGHLVRSLAIAGSLAEGCDVLFVAGGRVPHEMTLPPKVRLVALPAIGTGPNGSLVSFDPRYSLDEARKRRRQQLLASFDEFDPDIVLVELFPFGRRKFASEFLHLLEHSRQGRRRTVISSVRDLLVDAHPDKQLHDDEAAARLDAYFDAVVVHGDERFARIEETFRPSIAPRVPFYSTGFVAPATPVRPTVQHDNQVLVSAGGGLTGAQLLAAAVEAHRTVLGPLGASTRVVTGPFLPPESRRAIEARARGVRGLRLERFVPDLASAIAESAVSVSQCGYNTSIDLLRAGVPSVVVPYDEGRETEQWERAKRLESLGVVSLLPFARLSADSLARSVLDAATSTTPPAKLDLDGTAKAASVIVSLATAPTATS